MVILQKEYVTHVNHFNNLSHRLVIINVLDCIELSYQQMNTSKHTPTSGSTASTTSRVKLQQCVTTMCNNNV